MTKSEKTQTGILSAVPAEKIAPYGFGCRMGDVLEFDQAWTRPEEIDNAIEHCPCEGCAPKSPITPEPC